MYGTSHSVVMHADPQRDGEGMAAASLGVRADQSPRTRAAAAVNYNNTSRGSFPPLERC